MLSWTLLVLKEKDGSLKPVKKLNFSPLLKIYVAAFCNLAHSVLPLLSPFVSKWRYWRRRWGNYALPKRSWQQQIWIRQVARSGRSVPHFLRTSLSSAASALELTSPKKTVTNKFVPLIDADVIQCRKCLSNVDDKPGRIRLVLTSVLSKLLLCFWTRRTTKTLRQCFHIFI